MEVRLAGLALVKHAAAFLARARSHLDQVVGRADHVAVMLDHDDGVAEVAQPLERADQAVVVGRVQADARLIEHVGYADQSEAELGGESHALGLASGERAELSVECQVIEAGVREEGQTLLEPLARLLRRLDRLERRQPAREGQGLGHGHGEELREVLAAEAQREGLGREAPSAARLAGRGRLVGEQALAQRLARGRAEDLGELGEHADPRSVDELAALGGRELEGPRRVALEQNLSYAGRQLLPGCLGVEWHLLGERAHQRVAPDEHLARPETPGLHGAVGDRERGVLHAERLLEAQRLAEAAAGGAGAGRMVVREVAWRQRLEGARARLAGEGERERDLAPGAGLLRQHDAAAVALAEGELEGVGEPAALVGPRDGSVDDDVQLALGAPAQASLGLLGGQHLAVHAHPGESASHQVGQCLEQRGGFVAAHGRHQHQPRAGRESEERRQAVVERAAHHGAPVMRAAPVADQRPEQARVVGDLGHGRDRGARVGVAACALRDGHDG